MVSEAAAQVLRQFDVGQGALYPTRLTKSDKETPIGEGWYCLNYGNAKETVIPDKPIGMLRTEAPGQLFFVLSAYRKDDDLTVSRAALGSPDIWVDPRLKHGFFTSGRLARAIEEAKLKGFYLTRYGLAGARCKELAPAAVDISGCTTLMTHAQVGN